MKSFLLYIFHMFLSFAFANTQGAYCLLFQLMTLYLTFPLHTPSFCDNEIRLFPLQGNTFIAHA